MSSRRRAENAGALEVLGLVQRLVGLSNDVLVLDVSGHILDLVGDDLVDEAALLVVGLLDLAVRSLNKAVLIDLA